MRRWRSYLVACVVAVALCILTWASNVADINGDSKVDATDLGLFEQAWKDYHNAVSTWDHRADIYPEGSPDGKVDWHG